MLQLNNRLFEELAMDVYDEVDRRENETSRTVTFVTTLCHSTAVDEGTRDSGGWWMRQWEDGG